MFTPLLRGLQRRVDIYLARGQDARMWILVIAGLSVAPIFLGFLMEPWLPLGHWGWGALLSLCLLPSAIYWRKKIWNSVLQIWRRTQKKPLKIIAESPTTGESPANPEVGWINEEEAIKFLVVSSLVRWRLPNETMTIGEALLRNRGLLTSPTVSSIRAKEIARHLLKTYNDECSWGKRNGLYYKEYLEDWIGEKAYEDHAVTKSR